MKSFKSKNSLFKLSLWLHKIKNRNLVLSNKGRSKNKGSLIITKNRTRRRRISIRNRSSMGLNIQIRIWCLICMKCIHHVVIYKLYFMVKCGRDRIHLMRTRSSQKEAIIGLNFFEHIHAMNIKSRSIINHGPTNDTFIDSNNHHKSCWNYNRKGELFGGKPIEFSSYIHLIHSMIKLK